MKTDVRSRVSRAIAVIALLTGGLTSSAQAADEGVSLFALDGRSGSLIRHSFAANSEVVVGAVTDSDGKSYTNIDGAAHIPTHTNIMGFWYDNARHTSRVLYINIFTGHAVLVGRDLGDVRITGAATQTIGNVSRIFAVQRTSAGSELIAVNHITGDTRVVMSLLRAYDGLAALPDGTFYATDDDNLYLINPATGEETMLRALKHKHNESLEWMDGKLVGFSTAAGRLWRADTNFAEMSIHPIDSSVRDIRSIMVIDVHRVSPDPGYD